MRIHPGRKPASARRALRLAAVIATLSAIPEGAGAQRLRVVSVKDSVTEIEKPRVIYVNEAGIRTREIARTGLRVVRGASQSVIGWNKINEIRFATRPSLTEVPNTKDDRVPSSFSIQLTAELHMNEGAPVVMEIMKGLLAGQGPCGEFTIPLDEVKKITVLPR